MRKQDANLADAGLNKPEPAVTEERGSIVLATKVLPSFLPIIPLRPRPVFPNMLVPMVVSEPHQILAVRHAMENPPHVLGFVDGPDHHPHPEVV